MKQQNTVEVPLQTTEDICDDQADSSHKAIPEAFTKSAQITTTVAPRDVHLTIKPLVILRHSRIFLLTKADK